jgi:hypothetical protein
MPIDRIEVLVTDLTSRVQRELSSGAYDTAPRERCWESPSS